MTNGFTEDIYRGIVGTLARTMRMPQKTAEAHTRAYALAVRQIGGLDEISIDTFGRYWHAHLQDGTAPAKALEGALTTVGATQPGIHARASYLVKNPDELYAPRNSAA